MRVESAIGAVDLRPLAAYIAGHHPQALRLRQEIRWTITGWPPTAVGPEYSARFWVEVDELRRALRTLALADRVRPGVLVELHRAIDHFASVFREMVEALEQVAPEQPSPPGLEDWREVESLAGSVLVASPELQLWARLGLILGRCRLQLRSQPEIDRDGMARAVQDLPDLVTKLCHTRKYSFLKDVARIAEEVRRPGRRGRRLSGHDRISRWYLEFSRLGLQVQSALKGQQAPEPLLVIDQDRLLLLGETQDLAGHSEDQIAVLWLLAENAERPVARQTILHEGNIVVDRKASSLRSIVSRLRKDLLRPLIARSRSRKGGDPLPGERMAFILGRDKRRASHQWGAYTLTLDAARVQVVGPRPPWMRPATGHQ
jgi:hypothetical protein